MFLNYLDDKSQVIKTLLNGNESCDVTTDTCGVSEFTTDILLKE